MARCWNTSTGCCGTSGVRVCQAMSSAAAATSSVKSKPWLKSRAIRIFSTSAAGIGSPVS